MMVAEVGLMWPGTKECGQPLESGKGKGWMLPEGLQKE